MSERMMDSIQFHRVAKMHRLAVVLLLSVLVVTGVFWRLKLQGITLAGDAFCGMDEHAHSEACLAEGCTRTEHTHVELCYADHDANLETETDWERSLAEAPDTEFYTSDLIAVAKSQLGYRESAQNFVLGYDGARCGYTRYGEWYGNPYGEWSSMFVSFCLHYAGIPSEYAPYNSGVETMRTEWENAGLLFDGGVYPPIAGDLVFLDTDADGNAESVGILTDVQPNRLTAIVGDIDGAVAACNYLPTDARILSYGSMNEVIYASATEEELEYLEFTIKVLDRLPVFEDVDKTFLALEEDMDAYEAYYYDLQAQVLNAYCHWEAQSRLRPLVYNYCKAQELEWVWQASPMVEMNAAYTLNVFAVNPSSAPSPDGGVNAYTTILYDKTPADISYYSYFYYWEAVVIEERDDGMLYVSKFHDDTGSKKDVKATTAGGFVIYIHSTTEQYLSYYTKIGDYVIATDEDFYTSSQNFVSKDSPVGKLQFYSPDLKPQKNNNLTPIDTVNTRGLIDINLFDYGANVNTNYKSDYYYPAFKLGSAANPDNWSSLNADVFDLGAFVAHDVTRQGTSNNEGTINWIDNKTIELTGNIPLQNMMYPTLQNSYPAVRKDDGWLSLDYLFQNNTYATQKNPEDTSVSFLLQYDAETGKYFYDSRKNHAQYNSELNRFEVYNQLLTPCYSVYPFGNFLPFHDINTAATQTTEIDRDWYLTIAESAMYKYTHNYTDAITSEYLNTSNALYKMATLMDSVYGADWNYFTTVKKYFDLRGLNLPTEGAEAHFSNLYTLDFDEPTNFHFGMDMHMEFMMPKNGLTGRTGTDPMKYKFAGDDDVWVYIDGVLFLDLSGTHRHVGGEIDFESGKVYYYALDVSTGDVGTTPFKTVMFRELLTAAGYDEATINEKLNDKGTFFNYTEHTFDFYYMERGAGSGVCSMEFNMPLLQQNRITVIKKLDEKDADALGNPEFLFQLLKEDGVTPFIGEGVDYIAMDVNGTPETRTTGKNGVFVLYANERAVFEIPENSGKYFVRELFDPTVFEQYGTVSVDGAVTLKNSYTDVTIGEEAFKGVQSGLKDASDGNTVFTFVNKVDPYEYGALEIVKTANEYSDTAEPGMFTFSLLFGDKPVAVGTPYTLYKTDGTTETLTILTEGELTLLAGQRARFEKLLAGTPVTLKELYADDYIIQYTATFPKGTPYPPTENADESVTAPIGANKTTEISVFNDRKGEKLTVDGEKAMLYPDGEERTYTFVLEQITSANEPIVGGTYLEQSVTLANTANFSFTINYPSTTETGTYYYRIYEKGAEAAAGDDTSVYLLTVNIVNTDGAITETHTFSKDGETVLYPLFQNRNVRSLSVSKTVEGVSGDGCKFQFTVTASVGETPLSGPYHTSKDVIEFTDGSATFSLAHGETFTIFDLPYGTAWTVVEQAAAGFYTECAVDGAEREIGSVTNGTLNADATAAYYNIGGAELPATGGYPRELFPIFGAALMLTSTAGAFVYRKKRKER